MSFRSPLARLLVVLFFVLAASAQQAGACQGEVYFRVWQPGYDDAWYDVGDEIEIYSGEEAHIYVHVQGQGENTYSTAARIGYPTEFGFQGDARVVEKSVRMQAQNNEDRSNGRIRFRTNQVNLVYLGYEITGVASPGSLNGVSRNCRIGYIPIRVVEGE